MILLQNMGRGIQRKPLRTPQRRCHATTVLHNDGAPNGGVAQRRCHATAVLCHLERSRKICGCLFAISQSDYELSGDYYPVITGMVRRLIIPEGVEVSTGGVPWRF